MINLISGSSNPALTEQIASQLGTTCLLSTVQHWTCDEIHVQIQIDSSASALTNQHIHIVQSINSNDHVLELCLLADAAKHLGASHITAVIPYLGYSRQDKLALHGEANGLQCLLRLFKSAGINEIVTLDIHSTASNNQTILPLTSLPTAALFTNLVEDSANSVIISPDKGASSRAELLAEASGLQVVAVEKKRIGPGRIQLIDSLDMKSIQGKHCYIVDDILDSGNTMCTVANELHRLQAKSVTAFITHGLFGANSKQNIANSAIDRIFVTNSVSTASSSHPKTKVVDASSVLVEYLSGSSNV